MSTKVPKIWKLSEEFYTIRTISSQEQKNLPFKALKKIKVTLFSSIFSNWETSFWIYLMDENELEGFATNGYFYNRKPDSDFWYRQEKIEDRYPETPYSWTFEGRKAISRTYKQAWGTIALLALILLITL